VQLKLLKTDTIKSIKYFKIIMNFRSFFIIKLKSLDYLCIQLVLLYSLNKSKGNLLKN